MITRTELNLLLRPHGWGVHTDPIPWSPTLCYYGCSSRDKRGAEARDTVLGLLILAGLDARPLYTKMIAVWV